MAYIKINPRKVYESGMKYHVYADRVIEDQRKLRGIKENVEKLWTGEDSHNFGVSFESHIDELDDIIDFLEEKSMLLKENALNHNTSDNNFKTKMERSDMDEQLKTRL
ncbi:MAG: hypothetical protein IKO78_03165 [Bacilli bacterium]|nr:hypothetical protein [Bacilli bacterium]